MAPKSLKHIGSPEKSISEVESLSVKHNRLLRRLNYDFLNKIIDHKDDENYNNIFQSILYRSKCIEMTFIDFMEEYEKLINGSTYHPQQKGSFNNNFFSQQLEFDNLIFNACSYFDYLANLVEYICGNKRRASIKWNGLMNSVLKDDNSFSHIEIAGLLKQINHEWIDGLIDLRSGVIHKKAEFGGNTERISYSDFTREITIYTPVKVINKLSFLKSDKKKYDFTLHYAGYRIVVELYSDAIKILNGLILHVENNSVIPVEERMFTTEKVN